MRTVLLAIWLVIPIAAWAYHEGPGQEQLKLEAVSDELELAAEAVEDEDWAAAVERYEAALADLPEGHVATSREIRLALNKALMLNKKLPVARKELQKLVDELQADKDADGALLREARIAYANSQYYVTWLMRLEGYTREEWEPELEVARQTYRLLAEQAETDGDSALAVKHREDLESTVKLARMELSDLQGLPLPNQ